MSGHFCSGKSKWGLSKWGLKVLVHNGTRLPTIVVILRRKFPLERGPKRPQKCTIVDDCVHRLSRFVLPVLCRMTPKFLLKFLRTFIAPCLVAEVSQIRLHELLGAQRTKGEGVFAHSWINSVQTRCIVKGEAQKSPLFCDFLEFLIFSGAPVL